MQDPNVTDGQVIEIGKAQQVHVVTSGGGEVVEYSLDNEVSWSALDLTASASYPSAILDLPKCKLRFTLNGGSAQVSSRKGLS